MRFKSILVEEHEENMGQESMETPDFFVDLNLDQVVAKITASKEEYNLKPFFYTPLAKMETILYRQEIMQDLENKVLFSCIQAFAQRMRLRREHLAQADKLYYAYQQKSWFLDAAKIYCDSVACLAEDLVAINLKARGFLSFRLYLTNYVRSKKFTSLQTEIKELKEALASVRYCLFFEGNRNRLRQSPLGIKVSKYEGETDYSAEVQETFRKFQQGAGKDYLVKYGAGANMNHVEAGILELVAKLYPDIFLKLDQFYIFNMNYLDETIDRFDREIQFYSAYLEYMALFQKAGLEFCYPQISATGKEIYDTEGFDLALAHKLITENAAVVCNDFYLKDQERILVITGPNQGGKTTFARTLGQLHYLAALGLPVPGRQARLFLCDQIFTHFEKEEKIASLSGKLQDDLLRIQAILNRATPNSLVIMNEIFTSTTLQDALFLSKKIMAQIVKLDLLCVCVTFLDELASYNEKTVSMVSTVDPENPALRTYKIVRKRADGLSYALSIAEKYRLTYTSLKERIKS